MELEFLHWNSSNDFINCIQQYKNIYENLQFRENHVNMMDLLKWIYELNTRIFT